MSTSVSVWCYNRMDQVRFDNEDDKFVAIYAFAEEKFSENSGFLEPKTWISQLMITPKQKKQNLMRNVKRPRRKKRSLSISLVPTSLMQGSNKPDDVTAEEVKKVVVLLNLFFFRWLKCSPDAVLLKRELIEIQPTEPITPIVNKRVDRNPADLLVEDVHTGVRTRSMRASSEKEGEASLSKQPSFEKPMKMSISISPEANMIFTPGQSGDSERSSPSSELGYVFLTVEPEVQLSSGRKRRHSSRHSGANLAPVDEDLIRDSPEPDFKFRRISENEVLRKSARATPTQDPPAKHEQPMSEGANRNKAAQLFYQTLVLATHDYLKVEQTVPYGEILISKGSKM
ncbi:hypothetical protein MKW92_019062 [Papaver armeniacum]|nr:hypothetical protein MKW92_019062 [Papaver armeniacum]